MDFDNYRGVRFPHEQLDVGPLDSDRGSKGTDQESVEPWESTPTRRQSKSPWAELEHKDIDFLLKLAHDPGVDSEHVVGEMYSPRESRQLRDG